MKANFVYIEQRIAMEKLKAGEIDAVIVVGGKPYKSVSTFNNDGRFHLVRVDYDKPLQVDYLPATLTAKDYPNLIAEGEKVDTIAVPAVLAAYNWAPGTERYRKLSQFVDAFFAKFPTLQKPPFHPKWKEVSSGCAAGRMESPARGPAMAGQERHLSGGAGEVRRLHEPEVRKARRARSRRTTARRCSSNSRRGRRIRPPRKIQEPKTPGRKPLPLQPPPFARAGNKKSNNARREYAWSAMAFGSSGTSL